MGQFPAVTGTGPPSPPQNGRMASKTWSEDVGQIADLAKMSVFGYVIVDPNSHDTCTKKI